MARAQRVLSRRRKGSNRKQKGRERVAKIYARIASIRKDWLHKMTTQLLRENQVIVIEDLNVRGMLSNHSLARAISDIGFYEFRRQLSYKAEIFDAKIIITDRWFPSSKTCSCCGQKKDDLTLKDRIFQCIACGLEIDRDLNAAKNLCTLGLRGTDARGQEGSGAGLRPCETNLNEPRTKLSRLKFVHN